MDDDVNVDPDELVKVLIEVINWLASVNWVPVIGYTFATSVACFMLYGLYRFIDNKL